MPRRKPRAYRKPRQYRAAYPRNRGGNGMRRMEGLLVDTGRVALGVGVLGAIVSTSQGMWQKP